MHTNLPSQKFFRNKSAQQGVVLLEALIAILLFSLGVLALVGLQGAMIKNTSEAQFRSDASFIAQRRLGLIWANPTNPGGYTETATPITDLPNGTRTVAVSGVQVTVTVDWQQPGHPQHHYTSTAMITGG